MGHRAGRCAEDPGPEGWTQDVWEKEADARWEGTRLGSAGALGGPQGAASSQPEVWRAATWAEGERAREGLCQATRAVGAVEGDGAS